MTENVQHNDTSLRQTIGLLTLLVRRPGQSIDIHARLERTKKRTMKSVRNVEKREILWRQQQQSGPHSDMCHCDGLGTSQYSCTLLDNVMKRTTHMYRSANIMKQNTAHAGSHLRISNWNALHNITFCHFMRSKATAVPTPLPMSITHVLGKCTAT
jgi:hypothetical protein